MAILPKRATGTWLILSTFIGLFNGLEETKAPGEPIRAIEIIAVTECVSGIDRYFPGT